MLTGVEQIDASGLKPVLHIEDDVAFDGAVSFNGGTASGTGQAESITTTGQSIQPDVTAGVVIITVTTNDAFTIDSPVGVAGIGAIVYVIVDNTSGGAMGAVTWASGIKQPAAYTEPATGKRVVSQLLFDGAAWNMCFVSADLA